MKSPLQRAFSLKIRAMDCQRYVFCTFFSQANRLAS